MNKTFTSDFYLGSPDSKKNNEYCNSLVTTDSDLQKSLSEMKPLIYDVRQEVVDRIMNFAKNF